jgi:hypothetical protein
MQKGTNNTHTRDPRAWPHRIVASLAVCLAVSVFIASAFAQRPVTLPAEAVPGAAVRPVAQQVQITGVLVTYLPNRADVRLSDTGSSTYRRGSWMRILIQFASRPDWIDELRFDCYVLLRDGGNNNLLTGSVTCTNVQDARGHIVSLYVPPNTLERYGGRARGVAVECYYQNSLVSDYSMPRTTRKWWQDYTGIPDAMVTWFYTPFLRDGIGRFEQVKPQGRGF